MKLHILVPYKKDRQIDYLRQIDGWKEEEKIDIQELSLSKVAKNIYITLYICIQKSIKCIILMSKLQLFDIYG